MAHGKFRAESDPTRTVAQVGAENHNITPVKLINTPAEVIIIQVKRPKQNKKQSQKVLNPAKTHWPLPYLFTSSKVECRTLILVRKNKLKIENTLNWAASIVKPNK